MLPSALMWRIEPAWSRVLGAFAFAAIADAEEQAAVLVDGDARPEVLPLPGELVHPEDLLHFRQALLVLRKSRPHEDGAVAAITADGESEIECPVRCELPIEGDVQKAALAVCGRCGHPLDRSRQLAVAQDAQPARSFGDDQRPVGHGFDRPGMLQSGGKRLDEDGSCLRGKFPRLLRGGRGRGEGEKERDCSRHREWKYCCYVP